MAFKLPNCPSPRPNHHELADFAELLALVRGRSSAREIQSYLTKIDDNEENIGIEDDDERIEILSDGMITEIGHRIHACPGGYPFRTDSSGSIIEHFDEANPLKGLLYRYLLLATRLKMREQKIQAGIDGTHLMEELGAVVLKNYLGGNKAQSQVFGTAHQGSFEEKINELCHALREGVQFQNIDTGALNANDDGLDVVGWVPFADRLPAKICIFGQCKTGTSWRNHVNRLDPSGFVKRWMSGTIVVDPIKAFFISESADRSQWSGICIYGGILFDRCRMVDFMDELEGSLLDRIQNWTDAAMNKLSDWQWGSSL